MARTISTFVAAAAASAADTAAAAAAIGTILHMCQPPGRRGQQQVRRKRWTKTRKTWRQRRQIETEREEKNGSIFEASHAAPARGRRRKGEIERWKREILKTALKAGSLLAEIHHGFGRDGIALPNVLPKSFIWSPVVSSGIKKGGVMCQLAGKIDGSPKEMYLRLGQHKPRSWEKPHELPEERQAVVPTARAVFVYSNDHLSESQRVHLNRGGAGNIGRVKVAAKSVVSPAGPHSLLRHGHNFQDVKRQGSTHAISEAPQIFQVS
jgi:hypothetical protein